MTPNKHIYYRQVQIYTSINKTVVKILVRIMLRTLSFRHLSLHQNDGSSSKFVYTFVCLGYVRGGATKIYITSQQPIA